MPEPRRAAPADLDGIMALERAAFQPWRRASRAAMLRAMQSPHQSVWVIDDGGVVASLVLWHRRSLLRVYGLAVAPSMQGHGLGRSMMRLAERLARPVGRVVLEADADDEHLLDWYEAQGYRRTARRDDFYGPGRDAWRMEKLTPASAPARPSPSRRTTA